MSTTRRQFGKTLSATTLANVAATINAAAGARRPSGASRP